MEYNLISPIYLGFTRVLMSYYLVHMKATNHLMMDMK